MAPSHTAKLLTGITKIHITPESGRIHMTFSKPKLKRLKKLSIDLEMPIEDVIDLSIGVLARKIEKIDIDSLDQDNIINTLLDVSTEE